MDGVEAGFTRLVWWLGEDRKANGCAIQNDLTSWSRKGEGMKKILCLLGVVALTWIGGCVKQTPEDAAKSYVRQMVEKHKGIELNTSKLNYKVVEQDNGTAVIEVSGPVEVKAIMSMVKQGNKWVLAEKEKAAKKTPEHAAAVAPESTPKAGHETASMSKHGESSATEHKTPAHQATEHKVAAHKAE